MRESIGKDHPENRRRAEIRRREIIRLIEKEFVLSGTLGRTHFLDFLALYVERRVNSFGDGGTRTRSALRRIVQHLPSEIYLEDITTKDMEEARSKRLMEVSASSVNREVAALSGVFAAAVRWGRIDKNPCKNLPRIRANVERDRVLAKGEVKDLQGQCGDWLLQFVRIALATGMRREEIARTKWRDYDCTRKTLLIPRTKPGKSRVIPINKKAADAFEKLKRRSAGSRWVVPGRDSHISVSQMSKLLYEAVLGARLEEVGWHTFRHTWATRLGQSGTVSMRTLQKLGGWASLQMVEKYCHVSMEQMRAAMDGLDDDEE